MSDSAAGDRQTWVLSMLEEYEAPLARFAARLLGNDEAADDVVQHAFLRLCEQTPDDLRGREAQWLFTVCRNKAIDILRGRSRAASLDRSEVPVSQSKEPDPADAAEKKELYGRLNALVDELPTNQREAVALWSEGFTYRQIAEMVDRREGNVRVLVHRAVKRLREMPIAKQLLAGHPVSAGTNRLARQPR